MILQDFINQSHSDTESIRQKHLHLAQSKHYTRDQESTNHFCVYFGAIDIPRQLFLIGLHKKSNLWLFNGGHLDKNETPHQTLYREAQEEWGYQLKPRQILPYNRLSITPIRNPNLTMCKNHYDLWFFLNLDSQQFKPDMDKVLTEFHQIKWVNLKEAQTLITNPQTLDTLTWLTTKILLFQ